MKNPSEIVAELRNVSMLTIEPALAALGDDEEIFAEVVNDYYLTLAGMRDSIKEFFIANDISNYVIKVHGLKSSSRLIGANDLADLSLKLEMSGRENDIDTIKAETGRLILMTCNLEEELKKIFESDDSDKPEIPADELESCKRGIIAAAADFDFDTIDELMAELDNYRMPADFSEKYNLLKRYVADVARDDIMNLLQ